jgi:hypothetical protein
VSSIAESTTTAVSQRLGTASADNDTTVLSSGELWPVLVELSTGSGSKVHDGLRLMHAVHTVLIATPATVTPGATTVATVMLPRRHVRSAVHIAQSVRVVHRRVAGMTLTVVVAVTTATTATGVTASAATATAVVTAKVHVTLLLTIRRSSVRVVVTSHLLALQFGLDTLAVRSVADHRKDRSDAVDELVSSTQDQNDCFASRHETSQNTHQHALTRLGIVQRGLHDVVGERVPE